MNGTVRALTLGLAILLQTHASLDAQEVAGPGQPAPRACFSPDPWPRCRSFWITEFGVGRQITPSPVVHDTIPGTSYPAGPGTDSVIVVPPEPVSRRPPAATFATWELGGMVNRGADHAIGGSAFLAVPLTGEATAHYGVRAHYRWWSVKGLILDLSPGAFVTRDRTRIIDRATPKSRVGVVLRGAASRPNWIGLVGEVDLAPGRSGARLGARLSSFPGAAAGLGLPLLAGFLFVVSGDD